jgi:hypothetical protein
MARTPLARLLLYAALPLAVAARSGSPFSLSTIHGSVAVVEGLVPCDDPVDVAQPTIGTDDPALVPPARDGGASLSVTARRAGRVSARSIGIGATHAVLASRIRSVNLELLSFTTDLAAAHAGLSAARRIPPPAHHV